MAPRGPIVFSLDAARRQDLRIERLMINPDLVITLTQVREEIDLQLLQPLAANINERGQLYPGIIVALDPREAQCYVSDINEMWQSDHKVEDLVPLQINDKLYYFVLVAGHRRLRACKVAIEQLKKGEIKKTDKFDGRYYAEVHFGLSFQEAIKLQFSENIYLAPPPDEEAHAAWCLWSWRKLHEPKLTRAKFAAEIGKSPGWVRDALRFAELPKGIQELARGKKMHGGIVKLPYGILVQVARLQDGYRKLNGGSELTEEEMMQFIYRFGIGLGQSQAEFAAIVSAHLEIKNLEKDGQSALFPQEDIPHDFSKRRATVDLKAAMHVARVEAYFKLVLAIAQSGGFGLNDNPFIPKNGEQYSPAGPVRRYLSTADLFLSMVQLMEMLAQKQGRSRSRVVKTGEDLLAAKPTLELFDISSRPH